MSGRTPEATVLLSHEGLGELISVITYKPWAGAFSSEFLRKIQGSAYRAAGPELWARWCNRGESALVVSGLEVA